MSLSSLSSGPVRDHRRDSAVVRGRARHQVAGGGAARAGIQSHHSTAGWS